MRPLNVVQAESPRIDLTKCAHLIIPGNFVTDISGAFYRVSSKTSNPSGFTFKLADSNGKLIPTPQNFHPVSAALARTAAWMRFVFAYNKDFDLYVKEYIKEAGLPVDPKMHWDKWFQYTYPPKLSGITKDPDVVDEAIHQVIITALGKRKDLTKFDPKRLPAGAQAQPLAEQVTTYLQWLFKKRVSEAYEFIREKLQPAEEVSMFQEDIPGSVSQGEGEGERNILDTPEHATPGGQGGVEEATDLQRLRDQFAAWLQEDESPNEIKKLLVLYNLFTENVRRKLKISDYEADWKEKTGLGFDSLKPVYAKFMGYIPEFMVSAGLISADKAKARAMSQKSSLASLTLASTEEIPGAGEYTGDNAEAVTAGGPTSDSQVLPVAGQGPSDKELQENSHTENGGSPVLDGDLHAPERPNVNAMREALEGQDEAEVGLPIVEKEKELAQGEAPTKTVEVDGGGAKIVINITAGSNCTCGHHKTYHDLKNKMCHGGTKENPCNCDGRFKKEKAAAFVDPFPGLHSMHDKAQPARDAIDQLEQDILRDGEQDAVERTGDKEHEFNPKARTAGAKDFFNRMLTPEPSDPNYTTESEAEALRSAGDAQLMEMFPDKFPGKPDESAKTASEELSGWVSSHKAGWCHECGHNKELDAEYLCKQCYQKVKSASAFDLQNSPSDYSKGAPSNQGPDDADDVNRTGDKEADFNIKRSDDEQTFFFVSTMNPQASMPGLEKGMLVVFGYSSAKESGTGAQKLLWWKEMPELRYKQLVEQVKKTPGYNNPQKAEALFHAVKNTGGTVDAEGADTDEVISWFKNCPECDHPLPHPAEGCEVERGDHEGGEGDNGPYGAYAMGPCGCKYGVETKTSADDTGRMPHNPSAGGARTGPDGPIVVDEKTAAPALAPRPAAPRPAAPAVKTYGSPVGEKKDTDVLTDPNAPGAEDTDSGTGYQQQPRRKTVMPELPNAEMIMQLNASSKKYEAYGVKGMKSTQWRKEFNSHEEGEKWAEKNDAEILGWRDTEEAARGNLTASEEGSVKTAEEMLAWSDPLSGKEMIWMTPDQALSVSDQGRMDENVAALAKDPTISQQLEHLDPREVAAVLKEYGAWEELQDTEANLRRLLWIAGNDLKEDMNREPEEEEPNYQEEKDSYDFPKNWSEDERKEGSVKRASDFQHDAEIVVGQVLNGGFEQLWENYGTGRRKGYNVLAMIERTAYFFREKGREDIAQIFDKASHINGAIEIERDRNGNIPEEEWEMEAERLGTEFDPLESAFYGMWESNYKNDPNLRRDWETYFEDEPKDSPVFREMQKRIPQQASVKTAVALDPDSIAKEMLRVMGLDNGCTFKPSPKNYAMLKAGIAKMLVAGCKFNRHEIEIFTYGEDTEQKTLAAKWDGGQEAHKALNLIFEGPSFARYGSKQAAKNPEIWKRLKQEWLGEGSLSFSNKTQEFIVKEGYFYRHGRSPSTLAEKVKKVIPEAQITGVQDHFNSWPRNSWFEVRFKVSPAPVPVPMATPEEQISKADAAARAVTPATSEPKVEEPSMASTASAKEKRATLREKIIARRAERQAAKAAAGKFARVKQVAAEDPQGAGEGLEQVGDAFGQLADAVQYLRENLDLVDAPAEAPLKDRIAARRAFAKNFRQIAEQDPESLEQAINEVYQSLDETAIALENYADNMGLDLHPEGEAAPGTENSLADYSEDIPLEHQEPEPHGLDAVVDDREEEVESKEAAVGADAFSSDRDHDGHPKEATSGSDNFVTDRDDSL